MNRTTSAIFESGVDLYRNDELEMWAWDHVPSIGIALLVALAVVAAVFVVARRRWRRRRASATTAADKGEGGGNKLAVRRDIIAEARAKHECCIVGCTNRAVDDMHVPVEGRTGLRDAFLRLWGRATVRTYRVGEDAGHVICDQCTQDSLIEADLWVSGELHAQMQIEQDRAQRRATFARVEMYERLCARQRERLAKAKDFRTAAMVAEKRPEDAGARHDTATILNLPPRAAGDGTT